MPVRLAALSPCKIAGRGLPRQRPFAQPRVLRQIPRVARFGGTSAPGAYPPPFGILSQGTDRGERPRGAPEFPNVALRVVVLRPLELYASDAGSERVGSRRLAGQAQADHLFQIPRRRGIGRLKHDHQRLPDLCRRMPSGVRVLPHGIRGRLPVSCSWSVGPRWWLWDTTLSLRGALRAVSRASSATAAPVGTGASNQFGALPVAGVGGGVEVGSGGQDAGREPELGSALLFEKIQGIARCIFMLQCGPLVIEREHGTNRLPPHSRHAGRERLRRSLA